MFMGFSDGIDFNIDEQTDIAYAEVSFPNEESVIQKLHFELQKSVENYREMPFTKVSVPSEACIEIAKNFADENQK